MSQNVIGYKVFMIYFMGKGRWSNLIKMASWMHIFINLDIKKFEDFKFRLYDKFMRHKYRVHKNENSSNCRPAVTLKCKSLTHITIQMKQTQTN